MPFAGGHRPPRPSPATILRQDEQAVTELIEIPSQGHSLTIDSGGQEVAQTSLEVTKRFVSLLR